MYTGPPPPPQWPPPYPPAYGYTGPPPPPVPAQRPAAVIIVTPVSVRWPNACANCGAPPSRFSSAALKVGRTTRTYQVPVCVTCSKREARHGLLVGFLFFVVMLMAVGLGFAMLPLRRFGFTAIAGGFGISFVVGLLFYLWLKPAKPIAPFTSSTDSVRLTAWNANQAWFYCTNAEWAAEVVRLSGGYSVTPAIERPYRAWGTFISAPILTIIAEAIGTGVANPDVMLRNDTSAPLAFYIDGKKEEKVVEPGKYSLTTANYGHRTIGWGPPGDGKPAKTIDGEVKIGDAHLVNPEEAGCFWLDGATYGSASLDEKSLGPLPLQEFYNFDKVDLWFTDLPKSISTKQSGETRIAVQVYPLCTKEMKLCSKDVVKKALACDRAAKDEFEGAKCWEPCDGLTRADSDDKPDPNSVDAVVAQAKAIANAKVVLPDGGTVSALSLNLDAGSSSDAGSADAGGADAGAKKKKKKKAKDPAAPAQDTTTRD